MNKALLPENFLPHRESMQLIDSIITIDDNAIICEVIVRENNIFYDKKIHGIYAWIGIEFMAQTIAIFAGFNGGQGKPKIGLLLSVRKFSSSQPHFQINQRLQIRAQKIYLEDNVGVFDCEIVSNNKVIATAKLNTYQPSNEKLNQILRGNIEL